MRRLDETPIDPEIAAKLDAIDATLAGEPVDPAHAELAELALLLAAERPRAEPAFAARARRARVERRFAPTAAAGGRPPARSWSVGGARLAPRRSLAVAVVVAWSSGRCVGRVDDHGPRRRAAARRQLAPPGRRRPCVVGCRPAASSCAGRRSRPSERQPPSPPARSPARAAPPPAPPPPCSRPPNGRKIIQSAQLALTTRAKPHRRGRPGGVRRRRPAERDRQAARR